VGLYDWLLALHLISAFGLVAAVVANWTLVWATRSQVVGPEEAGRFGAIAGPFTGVMALPTLVFGVWLAFEVDAYELFDGWIIGAIVLWVAAMVIGPITGKAFAEGPAGRQKGVTLLGVNSVVVLAILILMIWKPGA
jgi:hypothetical protein